MKNVGGYYSRVHFLSSSYDYIVKSREFFKQNHSQSEPRNGMEVCVGFCIDSAHYRVCRCSINSLFSVWIGKKACHSAHKGDKILFGKRKYSENDQRKNPYH